MKEFQSNINPAAHNDRFERKISSPVKYAAVQKKNGSSIKFDGGDDTKHMFENPAVNKRGGGGTFSAQEAMGMPSNKKTCDAKMRELVGNCPIKFDQTPNNIPISEKRQMALNACFGSTGMKDSMTGANRRQIRNDANDKPQNKPITAIQSTHKDIPKTRAVKPKSGAWFYDKL